MKLPINLLLYAASAGLAGVSGWLFYQTMSAPPPKKSTQILEEAVAALDRGKGRTPDDRRDDYSNHSWWRSLEQANFVGKLPPKPVEAAPEPEPVEPERTVVPVSELLDVLCILWTRDPGSQCIVRYKPTANVQPPESELASSYGGPADGGPARMPQPGRPAGGPAERSRGGARPAPTPPPLDAGKEIVHHLEVGEALWPPHDDIVLARIAADASAVFFRRSGGEGEASAAEEKVFRNELELDQAVLEALSSSPAAGPRPPSAAAVPARAAAAAGQWIDVAETREVKPGEWHISKTDNQLIGQESSRIFHEDIAVRTYSSREGNIRGVQVTKVSPRMQRYGVQPGDVLLAINGVPVQNKAEALSVGKKQYRAGERVFRVTILNRLGRIEERTYVAPEN